MSEPANDLDELVFLSSSEAETDRLAEAFARLLGPGDVVALEGTLGAGKTRLVRGLAAALHADLSFVSSPTFGLVQHYEGDLPLVHIDAYRLSGDDEFDRMGGPELFDAESVTLIEWSERIAESLPRERWIVAARHVDEKTREYRVASTHRNGKARIEHLAEAVERGS